MKAYISHHIAGKTEDEIAGVEAEGVAFAAVVLGAYQVVLPREIRPWCETDIRYWNMGSCLIPGRMIPGEKHTVPCYLRADFEKLLQCDVVVMTTGWERSVGCLAELNLAVQVGIPVHFTKGSER